MSEKDQPMALGKVRALSVGARATLEDPCPVVVRCMSSHCRMRLMLEHELDRRTCDECAGGGLRAVQANAMIERIPIKFRWARLDAPMVPPGTTAPIATTDEARAAAREWLESTIQVLMIVGKELEDKTAPTGVGKSSFAGAVARAVAERGGRIMWVRAATLGPLYPDRHREIIDSIESAGKSTVFVDGIGKELAGALPKSGVITQRIPAMQDLFALVYECPETRFVLTSDITGRMLRDTYGGDAVRRIAMEPNAKLITLGDGK